MLKTTLLLFERLSGCTPGEAACFQVTKLTCKQQLVWAMSFEPTFLLPFVTVAVAVDNEAL